MGVAIKDSGGLSFLRWVVAGIVVVVVVVVVLLLLLLPPPVVLGGRRVREDFDVISIAHHDFYRLLWPENMIRIAPLYKPHP